MIKNSLNFITLSFFVIFQQITYAQVPKLRSTSGFVVFTSAGALHNDGVTKLYGDYGTHVGSNTGDSLTIIGNTHITNATTLQAKVDLDSVYTEIVAMTCDSTIGTPLGNNRVLSGDLIYCMTTAVTLTGNLYLDAQSDPDKIFIIKIDGALSTATNSAIILLNGASACNVFWQINGAVELGIASSFKGNIIANGAISLLKSASMDGRALSKAGAINLNNNLVVGCDGSGAPLPIILTKFYTSVIDGLIQINWTTATEINNDYFTLERSNDRINFEVVKMIKGAGNSSVSLNYSHQDINSYIGTSYYRLKQTDFDGKTVESNIIEAHGNNDYVFHAYPNPFQKDITIYGGQELMRGHFELRVYDVMGKECLRMPLQTATTQINTTVLQPGIYLFQILNNSRIIQSTRLVSQQ